MGHVGVYVAPPRGERGLKLYQGEPKEISGRVAPPRGERGLKLDLAAPARIQHLSLPLVGSVD